MKKKRNSFLVLKVVFVAVLLALLTRTFVFGIYKVPTSSMLPNLYVGDVIVASKFPFTSLGDRLSRFFSGSPYVLDRGDVVVFKHPENSSFYVKRVVGLPGDRVQINGEGVFINSQKLEVSPADTPEDFKSYPYYQAYLQTLNSGKSFLMIKRREESERSKRIVDFVVPRAEFFVLGDSRDSSNDSRDWGTVPRSNLEGIVFRVLLSVDWGSSGSSGLRLKRTNIPMH